MGPALYADSTFPTSARSRRKMNKVFVHRSAGTNKYYVGQLTARRPLALCMPIVISQFWVCPDKFALRNCWMAELQHSIRCQWSTTEYIKSRGACGSGLGWGLEWGLGSQGNSTRELERRGNNNSWCWPFVISSDEGPTRGTDVIYRPSHSDPVPFRNSPPPPPSKSRSGCSAKCEVRGRLLVCYPTLNPYNYWPTCDLLSIDLWWATGWWSVPGSQITSDQICVRYLQPCPE